MNAAGKSLNRAFQTLWHVDPGPFSFHDADVFNLPKYYKAPGFLRINLGVWSVIGVVVLITRYVVHQDPARAFVVTLLGVSIGYLLTVLLRRIYLRPPGPRLLIAKVMLLSLVAAGIHSSSVQGLINVMHWSDNNWSPWERMFFLSVILWVLYLAWSLGYFWMKAEVQARREKRLAVEAKVHAEKVEMQLLRAQLDPHFLFNTLQAIVSEIKPHPAAAIEMITELSSFLRYSLNHRHQQLTPLDVEIEAIQSYLKIQTARFGKNLEASISATLTARKILVPSFLLQPLVENAFKHGFEVTPAPWKLLITAELEGRSLAIMVRNSGKMLDSREDGVGLDTIRRRLEIHYPGRHAFDMKSVDGYVVAILHLEGEPCSV